MKAHQKALDKGRFVSVSDSIFQRNFCQLSDQLAFKKLMVVDWLMLSVCEIFYKNLSKK